MLKSHIAGQPHRIRPSSPRASISLRTAAQRRSRSASEGVGYSTSLRIALRPPALRAEVEPMPLVRTPPWLRRAARQERSLDGQWQAIQRDVKYPLVRESGDLGSGLRGLLAPQIRHSSVNWLTVHK